MCCLLWKSSRLSAGWDSPQDRKGIAVRTQWQFGPGGGNAPARSLMGNHRQRRRTAERGENQPNLSRKINPPCRHDGLCRGGLRPLGTLNEKIGWLRNGLGRFVSCLPFIFIVF